MKTKQIEKPVRGLRSSSKKVKVSFVKAFLLAKSEGLIIISNKRADQLLNGKDQEWKSIDRVFPINTGTMTAFIEPGKRFGATVEHKDCLGFTWVFEVPAGIGLRGLKNALLAVEHPNYDLNFKELETKKRIVVIPQKELILPVTNFPSEDGWYAVDPTTRIQINKPLDLSNPDARRLWRIPKRVGPVFRCFEYCGYDGGRGVYVDVVPHSRLGVLVEAKDESKK